MILRTVMLLPFAMGCLGDGGADEDFGDATELALGSVVVFDNPDRVFRWRPSWAGCEGQVHGAFLDLTRPPEEQDGAPRRSSIEFFRMDPRCGILSPGGVSFRGEWNTGDGPRSAFFAAGQDFVIEGNEYDLVATPPLLKGVGDTVGPDDRWVNGEPVSSGLRAGVQTAHFQDNSAETGPDEIWFTDGTVGVRFRYQGGIHYGFVELDWRLRSGDRIVDGWYRPLRWGYQPEPDIPLVIPP